MRLLQQLLAVVAATMLPIAASACDVCGCTGGGNQMGLLPLIPRHFVGMRYQSQGFHSMAHGSEPDSEEHFRSVDIWGRWQPMQRVQLMASMPVLFNTRRFEDGQTIHVNGAGDALLFAQFGVLQTGRSSDAFRKHTLQLGGGVKLPTGAYRLPDPNSESVLLPAAFQPGTGSTDWMLSGLYALQAGKWGFNMDASYRFAGENDRHYRFGNKFFSACRVFRSQSWRNNTFLPYAGASFDMRQKDHDNAKKNIRNGWICRVCASRRGACIAQGVSGCKHTGAGSQPPVERSGYTRPPVQPFCRLLFRTLTSN